MHNALQLSANQSLAFLSWRELVFQPGEFPMKRLRLFSAVILAAALISPVFAADLAAQTLPIKAPVYAAPANPCSLNGCSGFFLGGSISGSGTGVDVVNLGSLSADGTYMGINGGYQFFNGTYWLGVIADVSYAVAQPSSDIVGGGFGNKLFAFEGMEFGGALSQMPMFSNIAPLTGFLANAVPTIRVGACQNGTFLKGYCTGAAGHLFIPNSKWTVDAVYYNAQYGATTIAPGQTATTENRGEMGFTYHF
jgi:hypothetical protein